MPDPQTPNLQLYIPPNGADPGAWDVPMNANSNTLDAALGQSTTVPITNVNVTLSTAQYSCGTIIMSGIQTGDVTVSFPAYGRIYTIINICTNNTTWRISLQTTALGQIICAPPGEAITAYTDGTDFKYVGLGHVGTYWDFAGSTVPRWVSGCTIPPYLNCDGSVFNAATYPALNAFLGGNTLPDSKGRFRAALNQGSGRLTGGVNGNTFLAGGGNELILQANIPSYNLTGGSHQHPAFGSNYKFTNGSAVQLQSGLDVTMFQDTSFGGLTQAQSITIGSGGSGTGYAPPVYIGGLTLIRAG